MTAADIETAVRRSYSEDARDRCCGYDDDDHLWTDAGHRNPGGWPMDGSEMRITSNCQRCGLFRSQVFRRAGDGEDTEEYSMPAIWPDAAVVDE